MQRGSIGKSTLNESGVISIFGPFVVRPLDSAKTIVLLVYEFKLQVAIRLEAHLQKKIWGIMQRILYQRVRPSEWQTFAKDVSKIWKYPSM
jgi:hypothetical protein